ncbi:unnamed protein product [Rotaria sp. Silwood2]|nr:unnamed protein product [Rotaria sp. Silwood2]CAF2992732.1 unnamed protein product [Rotaria sp. Silwood2]CAF3169424.1 unnamed protein product [Rotaria sp. Silwood2]CAF3961673.1 unnamed protein product [Rotaria sp. Silwood2]CAF4132076.1 unnamed protein product [Rotaria sp. Silwood2]
MKHIIIHVHVLFLFDLQTQECKHYSQVQCGKRFESKDACDYHHSQIYNSIKRKPCWLKPSCCHKENVFLWKSNT